MVLCAVNNDRNFLALTALEESWEITRSMYFLGDWCRKYLNKEKWEKLEAVVIEPAQFKDKSHYDYHLYAISVYEKLLPKLANKLNEFHNTNYSLKYWQHLVGPFLFWYTQVVLDRFLYLQSAYEKNSNLEAYGLSYDSYLTPTNTNEFMCFASGNEIWNFQLFTQLLDLRFKKPVCYKKISRETEIIQRNNQYKQENYKLRTKFFLFLTKMISKFRRGKITGLLGVSFSAGEHVKLMLLSKFRIFPLLSKKPLNRGQTIGRSCLSQNDIDIKKRKQIFDIAGDDELSNLIIGTLSENMPAVFVEGYQEEVKLSRIYFPLNCSVIVVEQPGSHDQYKFWIASQIEKGAKILGYQHGGGYGMQKGHPAQFIESHVSDFFISWGWLNSNKIIPLPVPHLSRIMSLYYRVKKRENLNKILWIATIGGIPHSIAFCNWLLTQEAYILSQKEFYNALNVSLSSKIIMRASPNAYCQEQVNDTLKNLNIVFPENRDSFFSAMDTAKIVVIDHPSTSFLFTLAFNIPTILFWDKKYFQMEDGMELMMKSLEKAGIYYDTPKGAAEWLNKIIDNPYPWWNSELVQSARQQFCNQFALTSPNYLREWRDMLLSLMFDEKK